MDSAGPGLRALGVGLTGHQLRLGAGVKTKSKRVGVCEIENTEGPDGECSGDWRVHNAAMMRSLTQRCTGARVPRTEMWLQKREKRSETMTTVKLSV